MSTLKIIFIIVIAAIVVPIVIRGIVVLYWLITGNTPTFSPEQIEEAAMRKAEKKKNRKETRRFIAKEMLNFASTMVDVHDRKIWREYINEQRRKK